MTKADKNLIIYILTVCFSNSLGAINEKATAIIIERGKDMIIDVIPTFMARANIKK